MLISQGTPEQCNIPSTGYLCPLFFLRTLSSCVIVWILYSPWGPWGPCVWWPRKVMEALHMEEENMRVSLLEGTLSIRVCVWPMGFIDKRRWAQEMNAVTEAWKHHRLSQSQFQTQSWVLCTKASVVFLSASHEIKGPCLRLTCLVWDDLLFFFGGVHITVCFQRSR